MARLLSPTGAQSSIPAATPSTLMVVSPLALPWMTSRPPALSTTRSSLPVAPRTTSSHLSIGTGAPRACRLRMTFLTCMPLAQSMPSGELIVYAGVERLAPNGSSHIDIEFNAQAIALDEAPPCDNEPCDFLGDKTVGDILVGMEFENGGALGALRVYRWNGSNYIIIPGALLTGEGCNATDTICGFNNDGPADDGGPWPNYDNHGDVITTLQQNAFSEFGINLTALLGSSPCISSFMAHTRTSPGPQQDDPITSELKDFAGPSRSRCAASSGRSRMEKAARWPAPRSRFAERTMVAGQISRTSARA